MVCLVIIQMDFQAIVEGRGNRIHTRIPNMTRLADQIGSTPQLLTLRWAGELGAQGKYNQQTDETKIVGIHTKSQLARLI